MSGLDEQVNRRGFLGSGSAVAAGAVMAGLPGAKGGKDANRAGPVSLDGQVPQATQRAMIIQVARSGTVFPLRLPAQDRAGPARAAHALSRLRTAQRDLDPGLFQLGAATAPNLGRLRAAERAMPAVELAAARDGATLLIHEGLLDSGHAALLTGFGRLAATASPQQKAALVSAATLAVRVVFADAAHHRVAMAAGHWMNLLRTMHGQGTLRPAIRQRGLR